MNENDVERGRAIKDMTATDGWIILQTEINIEIEDEISALREIEIEKRGLNEIASEYLMHRERLSGLKRTFEIIEEILAKKEAVE